MPAKFLYNTVIKVPLIFYNPNLPRKDKSLDHYTTPMDILPTTLDLMGIKYNPKEFDGVSQRPVLEKSSFPSNPKRLIVSETNFHNKQKGMIRNCAIWNQRWKLIHNYQRRTGNNKAKLPAYELYDLHDYTLSKSLLRNSLSIYSTASGEFRRV